MPFRRKPRGVNRQGPRPHARRRLICRSLASAACSRTRRSEGWGSLAALTANQTASSNKAFSSLSHRFFVTPFHGSP